jgi:hypothetical protein
MPPFGRTHIPLGGHMPFRDTGRSTLQATTSIGRHDRVGRVIQGESLSIREDNHGLFGLARHRQAPIFYRNWPWKWVLSGQRKAGGGLKGYSESLKEQPKRGKPLDGVAFPDARASLGVVGTDEGGLFF